jgi:DNA-binding NarL/FixJ family response regulator
MTAKGSRPARPRVAVADKSPVVRSGLADIITRDGRFELVEVVPGVMQLFELLARQPVDIAVIGWSFANATGSEVLARLKADQSSTRVIIYTGEQAGDVLRRAIRGGAWGFLSKSDEPEVLLETIASVSHGRLCLPYLDLATLSQHPLDVLTTRERELLTALANGWSNQQIAARIGISHNTVKYHLKNLYDKLGVANRAMAVALFVSVSREAKV